MTQPTYLGIDLGTSAVRACLIDDTGELLATTRSPLTTNNASGRRTQIPAEWIQATEDCLKTLFKQHPADSVQSIVVDGTSGSVLLCDAQGKPLTNALMYNDASSLKQLCDLEQRHTSPHLALSITAGLPKALQLANNTNQPAMIQHQADWVSGWLAGVYGVTDENNALKTGYDVQKRCWPDWVQAALPGSLQLPRVVIPGTPLGRASKALQTLGVNPETQVLAGTTDSTAAFIASGIERMDQGATTLGSTLVIKQLSPVYIEEFDAGIYSHRLGDIWLTGGASNSGCAVLDQYFSLQQLQALSKIIDPGVPGKIFYYPLTGIGERFPYYDPHKQPELSPRPKDDHEFLKAMLEGIGEIEKAAYQKLNQLGVIPAKEIITSGGGSTNPVWLSIRQRILEIPVHNATYTEAAYGAALLALHGTGLWKQFKETL